MASEREDGFYWVRLHRPGTWEPGQWKSGQVECQPEFGWLIIGEGGLMCDADLAEIGERIVREPIFEQAVAILQTTIIRDAIRAGFDSPEFRAKIAAAVKEYHGKARAK